MWMKSEAPVMMGSSSLKKRSWEEELGFGEDIGGGGFVWPPRSYSCTFCRREFRSAQALGGHMNVHRRDRARLKQSLSSTHLHFHNLQDGSFSSKTAITQENSGTGKYCSSSRKELGSSSDVIINNNEELNYKRHKKSTISSSSSSSSSVGLLHKQCSSINRRFIIQQPEGLRIIKANNNLSLEDIDLELRLG